MANNVEKNEDLIITESLNDTNEHLPIIQQLGVLALILFLIFGTGYIPKVIDSINTREANTTNTLDATVPIGDDVHSTDQFETVTIQAQAAYVYDITEQKVLFEKNANEQLPLASITKLMTALVAHELLASNVEIPITVAAILQDGSSGLAQGESFALDKIIDLTLMSSSNDGAFAIAAAVGSAILEDGGASTFVQAMNIRARELGLTQTYFRNPTGLDVSETEGGSYGSAHDVGVLMTHILANYPGILEKTTMSLSYIADDQGNSHAVENTNPTVHAIEGLIGSKTGYTDLAGGNLTIAFDAANNRPIVVVVLGSSYTGRFDDVVLLSEAARNSL